MSLDQIFVRSNISLPGKFSVQLKFKERGKTIKLFFAKKNLYDIGVGFWIYRSVQFLIFQVFYYDKTNKVVTLFCCLKYFFTLQFCLLKLHILEIYLLNMFYWYKFFNFVRIPCFLKVKFMTYLFVQVKAQTYAPW